MSVKVTSNISNINNLMETKISLAIRLMLDGVDKAAYKNTPKDKGNLRNDILKQVLGKQGIIIWRKEYAEYQEDNQYKNYTTPGTGPYFASNAVKSEAIDNAEKYFRIAGIL